MEYDLVVIGISRAAIQAAEKATLLGARVALITQTTENYIDNSCENNYFSLKEATSLINKVKYNPWLFPTSSNNPLAINFNLLNRINNSHISTIENSLSQLAILGVDVIWGKGEFCRLPKQAFIIGSRKLRSRNFLIAINSHFKTPSIPGIELIKCLTYDDLWQAEDLSSLGDKLAIFGSSILSLELAQILARIGKQVILLVDSSRILPQEELAAIMVIQAQLEADGVDIITNATVNQIREIAGETWLEAGNKALVIDAIIAQENKDFNFEELNLQGVGVQHNETGIKVNAKLQTTNASIYACGDSIGLFPDSFVEHQINIALKNILLLPRFKIDYVLTPRIVSTEPTLASIGMIETEARRQYGDKIYVVREYFKNIIKSQISGRTTGWCQFIINSQGKILGCTIVGDRAEELISTIAVIMHHKLKLSKHPIQGLLKREIITIEPSVSAILQKTAISFQKQKLQRQKNQLNWLKTWLKIKRKFSKS